MFLSNNMDNYRIYEHSYLIDEDQEYKTLILYILKPLNEDMKRNILDILRTYEIIELMQNNFTELIIQEDDFNLEDIYEIDEIDLFMDRY